METQEKEKPIIEIYQKGLRYRVLMYGKELENLKSFSLQIDDLNGITAKDPAHCEIEQYLVPYKEDGRR